MAFVVSDSSFSLLPLKGGALYSTMNIKTDVAFLAPSPNSTDTTPSSSSTCHSDEFEFRGPAYRPRSPGSQVVNKFCALQLVSRDMDSVTSPSSSPASPFPRTSPTKRRRLEVDEDEEDSNIYAPESSCDTNFGAAFAPILSSGGSDPPVSRQSEERSHEISPINASPNENTVDSNLVINDALLLRPPHTPTKLKRRKSPPPPSPSTAAEPSVSHDPLTWHNHEITGHLAAGPDDDDGYGLNGIGFKPTPAVAHARAQKRKQQIHAWRAREAREARQRRLEKRRDSPQDTTQHDNLLACSPDESSANEQKRMVRFA